MTKQEEQLTSKRLLQLALDVGTLDEALHAASAAADGIDVIEAGTLLCVAEGMHAVRALRQAHPDKIIVADLRIARAGRNLAAMAFEAGADWVTAVGEAPTETLTSAAQSAREWGRELQVELPEKWDASLARHWRELGIKHAICHCTAEVHAVGQGWSAKTIDALNLLAQLGFTVTAAGGIDAATLPGLTPTRASVFVVGRSIVKAANPRAAALAMQELLA